MRTLFTLRTLGTHRTNRPDLTLRTLRTLRTFRTRRTRLTLQFRCRHPLHRSGVDDAVRGQTVHERSHLLARHIFLRAIACIGGRVASLRDPCVFDPLDVCRVDAVVRYVVETARGVFALRTLWKEPFSEDAYAASRPELSRMLLGTKQQQIIEAWFEKMTGEAEIVDNRDALRRGW